jgi:hypothetical protein
MYLYTETGKLIDRYVYENEAKKWGKPLTMSEDGQTILFRRSEKSFDFELVQVDINKFTSVKHVDMRAQLTDFLRKGERDEVKLAEKRATLSFWEEYLQKMKDPEDVHVNAQLNDHGDMIFRIKPNKNFLKREDHKLKAQIQKYINYSSDDGEESSCDEGAQEDIKNCAFFFFVPRPGKNHKAKHFLYFDSLTDKIKNLRGISMNTNYLFFWNDSHAWKMDIESQERTQLSICISEAEK